MKEDIKPPHSGAGEKNHRKRRSRKNTGKKKRQQSNPAPPVHDKIALIGFRGCGKSTIARHLHEMWGFRVLSLDKTIEKEQGHSISRIVAEKGWEFFRKVETEQLELAAKIDEPLILDAGGGIVEEADATRSDHKIAVLRENFFCIYLHLSEEKLFERLTRYDKGKRPALPGASESEADGAEEFIAKNREAFTRRKSWYKQAAHAITDISGVPAREAALRVARVLRTAKKKKQNT